jgi:ribonuclease D
MKQTTPTKAETRLLSPFFGLGLQAVIVPATDRDFAVAAVETSRAAMVGFDTESKPTFAVGEVSTGPHVAQFATASKAFIFQLSHPHCRPTLDEVLASSAVQKVGFGLASDRVQIRKKLGIEAKALIDLDTIFREQGYRHTAGVRAAVAIVLNQNFQKSKRVTTTNWSLPHLTPAQLLYAAKDAYAAFKVMEALQRGPEASLIDVGRSP